MPLPKKPGGPNRRRMTLKDRAELREREALERRREIDNAANLAALAALDLTANLDRLDEDGAAPPPAVYLRAAHAAAELAVELSAERSPQQREKVAAAWAALGAAMSTVERYHASTGFWEARWQIKRVVDPATGEEWERREYGPYVYRRYLDAQGQQRVEYHGKRPLPPEAPAVEDMQQTSSASTLLWPKPAGK